MVVNVSYLETIYRATNLKYLNEAYVDKDGDVILSWAGDYYYEVLTVIPNNNNNYKVLSLEGMNTLKNLLGL